MKNSFINMANEDYPDFAKQLKIKFGLELVNTEFSISKKPNSHNLAYSFYLTFKDRSDNKFIIRVSDHEARDISYYHLYSIKSCNGQFQLNKLMEKELRKRLDHYYFLESLPLGTYCREDDRFLTNIDPGSRLNWISTESMYAFKYTREAQINKFE